MYARSTTVQANRESIDAGIARIRDEVLPALRRMDGCMGLSMLVDRESCRCIATSSWESEGAMRAAAEQVGTIRDRAVEILGGIAQVEEWEILVMHRNHESNEGACARCEVAADAARQGNGWRNLTPLRNRFPTIGEPRSVVRSKARSQTRGGIV